MRASIVDNGSASVAALVLLVLMAAVTGGGALVLAGVLSYTAKSSERERARLILRQETRRAIGLLVTDPTPEADSPLDPVWSGLCAAGTEGVRVTLEDVSSRLNVNWVQKGLLESTALGELLRPSATVEAFQQRREDRALSTDIVTGYQDLIREEAISRFFTGYGYANLNTTDGFALRKLYVARMRDAAGAEVFHALWRITLTRKKMLKRGDLRDFLGPEYAALYPTMNVEPTFNVHFTEPRVLTEILSLPPLSIPQPRQAAQRILDARDHSEITMPALQRMIGAPGDNLVYQYLGVTTWFWKLTVSRGSHRLETIVARIPSETGGAPRFLLAEERHLP